VSSPPPEETTCDELTTNLPTFPCPPVPLKGRRWRKTRSKVKPKKKGGVGGRHFKI